MSSHSVSQWIKEYGEDAVRLAVNSNPKLNDLSEIQVDLWQRKINILWELRHKIITKANTKKEATELQKRVVILHARSATPDMNFYPWLKQAMLAEGFQVISPLVSPCTANYWTESLQEIKSQLTKETTVVAHSIAALALCSFLQENTDIQLKAVHFVGGVFDDFLRLFQPDDITELARSFSPENINYAAIAKRIGRIHLHHSTDDSRVLLDSSQRYLNAFGVGTLHEYQNRDHFFNQPEFPELAEIIVKENLKKPLSILLDFDGVLANTWETTYTTRMAVSRLTKPEAIEHEKKLLNKPYFSKEDANLQEQLAQKEVWQKQYRNISAQLRPELFVDFIEALKQLNNVQFAVVSSNEKQIIEQSLKETGLPIDEVLDYKHSYSKQEKVLEMCKTWEVSPEEIYYITDTIADVVELESIMPKENIVGVSWGYCSVAQMLSVLPEKNVLLTARDLFELFNINPLFQLSSESEKAYKQVQQIIFDEDELNSPQRLELLKNCIECFSKESFIQEAIWTDLLMALAPFSPVLCQELWSNLEISKEVPFIHETV